MNANRPLAHSGGYPHGSSQRVGDAPSVAEAQAPIRPQLTVSTGGKESASILDRFRAAFSLKGK